VQKKKSFRITTPSGRRGLKLRREPYWHYLRRGGHVGYRRSGYAGSWIARWRSKGDKHATRSLGDLADYDDSMQFNQAAKLANAWFDERARPDAPKGRQTVGDAVDSYLDCLEAEKSPGSVQDARWRANAYILPKFGKTFLDEITTRQLTRWRNAFVPRGADGETLRKARDTANRHLNTLRAILNRAHKDGLVSDDAAWRRVKRFKGTTGKRGGDEALSDAQIGRLLEHSKGGFRDLVTGLLLTGMRPGREIECLLREQYRVRGDSATLELRESKTGPRTVFLSREGRQLFDHLAKGKTPKAHLFTMDDGLPWKEKEAAHIMREVRKAAKLPAGAVLYSLRHSHITKALENGAGAKLICDNVGTSLTMLERHYWGAIRKRRQEMLDGIPMLPKGVKLA